MWPNVCVMPSFSSREGRLAEHGHETVDQWPILMLRFLRFTAIEFSGLLIVYLSATQRPLLGSDTLTILQ
jgi:hypothetical protein